MPEHLFACSFGSGQWDPKDWWMVQSPRWNHSNDWIQEPDHIRNQGPETSAGETYTSMICTRPLEGDFVVRSEMSFDERMAPLLVVGERPAPLPGGHWEYREHFELVLFDEGLNLWHHTWADGEASWTLPASWRFALQPGQRYELSLSCTGSALGVALDGVDVGTHIGTIEGPLVAGLTACEGTNHFYNFAIERC